MALLNSLIQRQSEKPAFTERDNYLNMGITVHTYGLFFLEGMLHLFLGMKSNKSDVVDTLRLPCLSEDSDQEQPCIKTMQRAVLVGAVCLKRERDMTIICDVQVE